MIDYKERVKRAAPILRGLREKAGIIDDPPPTDFEICSLEKIVEIWEIECMKARKDNKCIR